MRTTWQMVGVAMGAMSCCASYGLRTCYHTTYVCIQALTVMM